MGGGRKRKKEEKKKKSGGEEAAEVGVFLVQLPSFPEKKNLAPALTRQGARENVANAPFSSCI